jgi:hypothetical protein
MKDLPTVFCIQIENDHFRKKKSYLGKVGTIYFRRHNKVKKCHLLQAIPSNIGNNMIITQKIKKVLTLRGIFSFPSSSSSPLKYKKCK